MVQRQSTIYKSVVSHESPLSTGFPRCPILATTKLTGTSGALHCAVKTDHALQFVSFYCRRVALSSVLHVCVSCLSGLQCHHPSCPTPINANCPKLAALDYNPCHSKMRRPSNLPAGKCPCKLLSYTCPPKIALENCACP